MKLDRKLLLPSLTLGVVLVLAACGGDGGDDNNAGGGGTGGAGSAAFVPDSAATSVTAFLDFVSSLSTTDDTSEPLLIKDSFVPPIDDIGDPRSLS